jgi:putative phosphoribosyl transferase
MTHTERFKDRLQAGKLLAKRLRPYAGRPEAIVLALPRGGVPVGFEVAQALGVALDILIVRKLGMPGHEEYAMGAIASGGLCVLQADLDEKYGILPAQIEAVKQRELAEIERREHLYRAARPVPELHGRIVILVDDGLATGSTMLAAIQAVRQAGPAHLIVAVPVAAPETCRQLGAEVDEIICLHTPDQFFSVGMWYQDFKQTTDQEVIDLLGQAESEQARRKPPVAAPDLQSQSRPG